MTTTISTAGDRNADWTHFADDDYAWRDRTDPGGENETPDETALMRIARICNAKEKKGKPCGDSHIEAGDTCHVGETKPATAQDEKAKAQQDGVDREVAGYLYGSISKHVKPTSLPQLGSFIDAHEGVAWAMKRIGESKNNATGWMDRVKVYSADPEDAKQAEAVGAALDDSQFPKHGSMGGLVHDIKDGVPHAFLMVGRFAVDPYLKSRGVSHDDINKFDAKLAGVFEKAGIAPSGPLDTAHAPKTKGKASTDDVLGPAHTTHATDDDPYDDEGKLKTETSSYGDWYKSEFGHEHKPYVPPPREMSAGSVVFRDDGKVLVVHPKNNYGGYHTTWPKGRVDKGEDHIQTMHREVGEEAGVEVGEPLADLGTHKGTSTDTHYFLTKHKADAKQLMDTETESTDWLTPEEAADQLDTVRDLRVLVKAMSAMKAHLQKTT